jgi:hypothetical protein
MSLLEGFDFISAEKDMEKKIEELANVVERVATIFLNGVGSLEEQIKGLSQQLSVLDSRITKAETQVETVLRMGSSRSPASSPASPDTPTGPTGPKPPPTVDGPGPRTAPTLTEVEQRTPTSPMSSGLSVQAEMRGELKGFLARRRAALEARMKQEEEGG